MMVVASFSVLPLAATIISIPPGGLQWGQLAVFFVIVMWFLRAAAMGLSVTENEVIIRSWYVTYRIPTSEVKRVDIDGYSGMINGFTQNGFDPLRIFLRMIVIETTDEREREYQGTISSRRTARRMQAAVFGACPNAQGVRSDDESGSPRRDRDSLRRRQG
ncbi:hypothetical protein ASF23_05760 [Curtobacterium sp. Leaf261]|nr:hypothetical protein ASF23_05760 [Curtobacterium sp. Leaf261]